VPPKFDWIRPGCDATWCQRASNPSKAPMTQRRLLRLLQPNDGSGEFRGESSVLGHEPLQTRARILTISRQG
jgi:hypothetical protein